jgi:hypothetical protein
MDRRGPISLLGWLRIKFNKLQVVEIDSGSLAPELAFWVYDLCSCLRPCLSPLKLIAMLLLS